MRLHIPAFVNWECRACGRCCFGYEVALTEDERRRLEQYDLAALAPEPRGRAPFDRGRRGQGDWRIHFKSDDTCVFLGEQGLCRIHAAVKIEDKPLACRLFPAVFAITPSGAYLGLRFNCEAMARGIGAPLARQERELEDLLRAVRRRGRVREFGERVKFGDGKKIAWEDYLFLEGELIALLLDEKRPLDARIESFWGALSLLRESRLEKLDGPRFREFSRLVIVDQAAGKRADAARRFAGPAGRPGLISRMFFRQALYLLHRRAGASFFSLGRWARLRERGRALLEALKFSRGKGRTRMFREGRIIELERVATVAPPPNTPEIERILSRYLAAKLYGKQVFGPMFFNYSFADGCAFLLVAHAAIGWFARAHALSRGASAATLDDVVAAMVYVDYTYGYSPFPALFTERLRARFLGRGDLPSRLAHGQWGAARNAADAR